MIDALPYIGSFLAVAVFIVVAYSFGYVHGSDDEATGKLHWAEARWEAFFQKHKKLEAFLLRFF